MRTLSEAILNRCAIGIELGVPLLLALACWRWPERRRIFGAALLAISPALLLFAIVCVSQFHARAQSDFAFSAIWLMSFLPYMALLTIGLLVGFLRHRADGVPQARAGPPNVSEENEG